MSEFYESFSDPEKVAALMCAFVLYRFFILFMNYLFTRHYSKKCSYDCESCRDWKCQAKDCADRREKLGKGAAKQ